MRGPGYGADAGAAGAGEPSARPVVDVVILTRDAGLLATLRQASSPRHALWPAESADAAVDLLVGGRCGILIADLALLPGDAAALLDRLHGQFPELVAIAVGRRAEESSVARLLTDGRIYRFLHKPVSPARATLFINTATRRYGELRNIEALALATARQLAVRRSWAKYAIAGVLCTGALAALIFWWAQTPSESPATTSETARARTDDLRDTLARARRAYEAGQLLAPAGDNALGHFHAALAIDPQNAAATAGVNEVLQALQTRVEEALSRKDLPQAVSALTALQQADPAHPEFDRLRNELLAVSRTSSASRPVAPTPAPAATSTAPANASQASPQDPTTAQRAERLAATRAEIAAAAEATQRTALSERLARIRQLREAGQLLEPAGANAYDELIALRESTPDSEEQRAERQRLTFALLEHARTTLATDPQRALTFARTADTLVPGMSNTRALLDQASAALQLHNFMADVVSAAELKGVRQTSTAYPREAERAGIEGWVDVEFTVTREGTTEELVVRDAEPGDLFDEAAIDSVSQWRFEPVTRNGTPAPQRAWVRVRFVLE